MFIEGVALGVIASRSMRIPDDNWLNCYVELKFGGFTGSFEASFLTREFILLLTQIEKLYDSLEGEAKFHSMEQQLEFTLKGNGKGEIELTGEAMDFAGPANQLDFFTKFDQTFLPTIIQQLKVLVARYPERTL